MSASEDHASLKAYIDGVDATVRQAEAKWGIGRLPMLVDNDFRAKFYRQQAKWRAALETAYDAKICTSGMMEAVKASSAAMGRAWGAIEASAVEAGHKPIAPDIWEIALKDGRLVAFVQTSAEAGAVIADGRHVVVYTLDEVGNLLDALPDLLGLAKAAFPGAEVVAKRERVDRSWTRSGDEIPFG